MDIATIAVNWYPNRLKGEFCIASAIGYVGEK